MLHWSVLPFKERNLLDLENGAPEAKRCATERVSEPCSQRLQFLHVQVWGADVLVGVCELGLMQGFAMSPEETLGASSATRTEGGGHALPVGSGVDVALSFGIVAAVVLGRRSILNCRSFGNRNIRKDSPAA